VGEPLDIREAGTHETFVKSMLLDSLEGVDLDADSAGQLIVAYEPVWAIGTGKTATALEAGAMHQALRATLDARFGTHGARVPLLYGGSVKPANAAGLFEPSFVDGFLVGGAALDARSFVDIVSVTAKARRP
jgi:triosephosphate isomerase